MAKPSRPSIFDDSKGEARTFFITTSTAGGRALFQTERMSSLLIEVLRSCARQDEMTIHEFVIMPNHVHILLTVPGTLSIEKAVQLIKGRFSFRAGREIGFKGEVWQRGFSDVRIMDENGFARHREYIEQNPVKAGLASEPEEFPFGSACLKKRKQAGAKAQESQ